jgi:outer membrane biosynthesis protein TonB
MRKHPEVPTRVARPGPVPLPHLSLPSGRRRYAGFGVSLALHGALLALIILEGDRLWRHTPEPGAAALFLYQGGGGGGGGNRVAYITLPSPPEPEPRPPAPAPPPPVTPPAEIPPSVEETEVVPPTPAPVDTTPAIAAADSSATAPATAGTGPGDGSGSGGGAGGGDGPGAGPGSGDGTGPGMGGGGGVVRPPELRDLAFPFETPPKELRGASLDVTFWVRVDGRVERYEVRPAISDRDYAQKFDEVIRAFRFTPARAPDGTKIAGTTRVTFTLPGKRSS